MGDATFSAAPILRRVSAQRRSEDHEMPGLRKNGSVIDTALTVAPVSAGGEVTLIARDVTERKRSEHYLERTFGTYLDREIAEHILREGPGLRAAGGRRHDDVRRHPGLHRLRGAVRARARSSRRSTACSSSWSRSSPSETGTWTSSSATGCWPSSERPSTVPITPTWRSTQRQRSRAQRRSSFQGDLEIGIGIDSGTVIAGNVGGGGRLDFTVIGDAVNTAARIETATRDDRRRRPVQRAHPAAGCAGTAVRSCRALRYG